MQSLIIVYRYGQNSRLEDVSGIVVHVRTQDDQTHGCAPFVNVPAKGKWIALISRGNCKFSTKVLHATSVHNGSAVVIYNNQDDVSLITMDHKGELFRTCLSIVGVYLRLPYRNDAEIANFCNLWTFWPVTQLINHLFTSALGLVPPSHT